MPTPDLPTLPYPEDPTSLLALQPSRETANYFSGSPLNRLSFLRASPAFLQSAFAHPRARFRMLHPELPMPPFSCLRSHREHHTTFALEPPPSNPKTAKWMN